MAKEQLKPKLAFELKYNLIIWQVQGFVLSALMFLPPDGYPKSDSNTISNQWIHYSSLLCVIVQQTGTALPLL